MLLKSSPVSDLGLPETTPSPRTMLSEDRTDITTTGLLTRDSISTVRDTDSEPGSPRAERSTQETGPTTRSRDPEERPSRMVLCMLVPTTTTRSSRVNAPTPTKLPMRETGRRTSQMDRVLRPLQTELFTRDPGLTGTRTDRELSTSPTELTTRESS